MPYPRRFVYLILSAPLRITAFLTDENREGIPMQTKLALIREAVALALKELDSLKGIVGLEAHGLPELDELEMGLEWSMKRVDRLQVLVEVKRADAK
ncbi:unnamed protein product [uncultured bacterium]|nr:unnamed protein product [uncultured bacterium]